MVRCFQRVKIITDGSIRRTPGTRLTGPGFGDKIIYIMKRTLVTATIAFSDGSAVQWTSLGRQQRLYKKAVKYAIKVRVENGPKSIDAFFESWDKPSMATALHFIKNATKDAKEV